MRDSGNISCKQDWKLHVVTRICENSKGQAEGMGVPKEKLWMIIHSPLRKIVAEKYALTGLQLYS